MAKFLISFLLLLGFQTIAWGKCNIDGRHCTDSIFRVAVGVSGDITFLMDKTKGAKDSGISGCASKDWFTIHRDSVAKEKWYSLLLSAYVARTAVRVTLDNNCNVRWMSTAPDSWK